MQHQDDVDPRSSEAGSSEPGTGKKVLGHLRRLIEGRKTEDLKPADLMCAQLEIAALGEDADGPWVRLANGRIFYGYASKRRSRRVYHQLADRLPAEMTERTYEIANDVARRYAKVNYLGMPGVGGVIVEGGAYTGLKAIAFADIVGPTGRVLAIEMMPDNFALMQKNIQVNNLGSYVTPVNVGLWNERGTVVAATKNRQQNSLVDLDDRSYRGEQPLPTETLPNLLDQHDIEQVDFLNLQINGAEIEALDGLGQDIDRIRVLRIASYYHRQGVANADVCCSMLEKLDCVILKRGGKGSILASPRRYESEHGRFVQRATETLPRRMLRDAESTTFPAPTVVTRPATQEAEK